MTVKKPCPTVYTPVGLINLARLFKLNYQVYSNIYTTHEVLLQIKDFYIQIMLQCSKRVYYCFSLKCENYRGVY